MLLVTRSPTVALMINPFIHVSYGFVCFALSILFQKVSCIDNNVRQYYIAAETVHWDYAPLGSNICTGDEFEQGIERWQQLGLGTKFFKTVYKEYTDDTFKTGKKREPEWEHLGVLGPLIQATIGDIVKITLHNKSPFPVNIHPSGLPVHPGSPTTLQPSKSGNYTWQVPDAAGPAPGELDTKLLLYYSSALVEQRYYGLLGPILISKKKADETEEVDQHVITVFQLTDENNSPYFAEDLSIAGVACTTDADGEQRCRKARENSGGGGGSPFAVDQGFVSTTGNVEASEDEFRAGNVKPNINGYVYCNMPQMKFNVGDRYVWHSAALSLEDDVFSPVWHGTTMLVGGRRVAAVSLQSGETVTGKGVMDSPGVWMLRCQGGGHSGGSMRALMKVEGSAPQLDDSGVTHTYYVKAELESWDYAPQGGDACSGRVKPFGEAASVYVDPDIDRIGRKFIKAQYIEYTDETFVMRKERDPRDGPLGILGPIFRAEVGDTIVVTLSNGLPRNYVSMHPDGLWYGKGSEGSSYNDSSSLAAAGDDFIPPGAVFTYTWKVPERAGPGPRDPSSIAWLYYSGWDTDPTLDVNAGLIGAIIVTKKGSASTSSSAHPRNVDREFVFLFQLFNEEKSRLWHYNVQSRLSPGENVTEDDLLAAQANDEDFDEANKKYSINGYLYCNLPDVAVRAGEYIRMHFLSLTTEPEPHVVVLEGATFHYPGIRADSVPLNGGDSVTVDVILHRAGGWKLQSKVDGQSLKGMSAYVNISGELTSDLFPGAPKPDPIFIAAETLRWDYAPGQYNCSTNWTGVVDAEDDSQDPGLRSYPQAVYRQYTDHRFAEKTPVPSSHGLVGPILHTVVGDALTVVFSNKLPFSTNIEMAGGAVSPRQRIAGRQNVGVTKGHITEYTWDIPEELFPDDSDDDVIVVPFGSSVDPVAHSVAGLVGLLVVHRTDDTLGQIDSHPLVFMVQNQTLSPFAPSGSGWHWTTSDNLDGKYRNVKYSINGFSFCTLPPITVTHNSTTRWLVATLGSADNMHTPIFQGQVVSHEGRMHTALGIMPMTTKVVDVEAVSLGDWEIQCMVGDHTKHGMRAKLIVMEA